MPCLTFSFWNHRHKSLFSETDFKYPFNRKSSYFLPWFFARERCWLFKIRQQVLSSSSSDCLEKYITQSKQPTGVITKTCEFYYSREQKVWFLYIIFYMLQKKLQEHCSNGTHALCAGLYISSPCRHLLHVIINCVMATCAHMNGRNYLHDPPWA